MRRCARPHESRKIQGASAPSSPWPARCTGGRFAAVLEKDPVEQMRLIRSMGGEATPDPVPLGETPWQVQRGGGGGMGRLPRASCWLYPFHRIRLKPVSSRRASLAVHNVFGAATWRIGERSVLRVPGRWPRRS